MSTSETPASTTPKDDEPTQPFSVNENTVDDPSPPAERVDDAEKPQSRKDFPINENQPFGVNENTVDESG